MNNKKLLLKLGFNKKEITLFDNNKDIEELIVLLESLNIKDIKDYLLNNKYLFTKNIFYLAKIITLYFNNTKDYTKTKKLLTSSKYTIINEKGDCK